MMSPSKKFAFIAIGFCILFAGSSSQSTGNEGNQTEPSTTTETSTESGGILSTVFQGVEGIVDFAVELPINIATSVLTGVEATIGGVFSFVEFILVDIPRDIADSVLGIFGIDTGDSSTESDGSTDSTTSVSQATTDGSNAITTTSVSGPATTSGSAGTTSGESSGSVVSSTSSSGGDTTTAASGSSGSSGATSSGESSGGGSSSDTTTAAPDSSGSMTLIPNNMTSFT